MKSPRRSPPIPQFEGNLHYGCYGHWPTWADFVGHIWHIWSSEFTVNWNESTEIVLEPESDHVDNPSTVCSPLTQRKAHLVEIFRNLQKLLTEKPIWERSSAITQKSPQITKPIWKKSSAIITRIQMIFTAPYLRKDWISCRINA